MKNKYFYQIFKLKIKPWLKYWLIKQTEFKGVLSDILEGISFYLTDSLNMKFKMFKIYGRTTQESTTGKNLFDKDTVANGKYINDSGEVANSPKLCMSSKIQVNAGETYTISGLIQGEAGYQWNVSYWNGDTYLSRELKGVLSYTFVIPTNCTHIILSLWITDLSKVQLEEGSTATSYEPYTGGEPAPNPNYPFPIKNTGDNGSVNENVSNSDGTQEQNISFPLAQGQKLMEGDYLADDGVHHKRKQKIFDGSDDENWSLQSINSNGIANFAIGLADYSGRDENLSLCDYFSSQSTPIAQTTNEGYYLTISKTLYIRIKSTTASTVAELRTWLSIHNTTFEYELAEEQTEDFTEEQKTAYPEWKKARTYKNITHISSEDETPAELKIQYWKEV